jgi:hypothetical protein
MRHAGNGTRHSEAVLYAFEKEVVPLNPIRLLEVGVENGGSLEVWRDVLPEGSEVVGIDVEPLCGELGLNVLIGDATDQEWLQEALGRQFFHVIVNSTGERLEKLWPWLVPGGVWMWEGYDTRDGMALVEAVNDDVPAWLPCEEIIRVAAWPEVLVVEKRTPKVVPYLEVLVGNFFDVVPEQTLMDSGIKRLIME